MQASPNFLSMLLVAVACSSSNLSTFAFVDDVIVGPYWSGNVDASWMST